MSDRTPNPAPGTRADPVTGLAVWSRIVAELEELQDAAPPMVPGSVVNPICGRPYVVDTCCAAKVFAAEYRRTGVRRWQERAHSAMTAARAEGLFSGVGEATWNVLGWHEVPDSLPPTAIAIDAYWDAQSPGETAADTSVNELLDFLGRCRRKRGGYAHNAVGTGPEPADVQNATASAVNLLSRLAGDGGARAHPVYRGLEATVSWLHGGQRASGFWPYRHGGGRLRESLRKIPGVWRLVSYKGGGDIMHHLMTLYFASGAVWSPGDRTASRMLGPAWRWIAQRLRPGPDGGLRIDWAAEAAPESAQFSNARDTNAYFLILGAIPRLVALGIVGRGEATSVADGLLAHIERHLMAERGRAPSVVPSEGPLEIVRNILPMFEQSVAWKGSLLANIILAHGTAS